MLWQDEYNMHIKALKQQLGQGPILEKVHRVKEFNKKAWLKSDIVMNN